MKKILLSLIIQISICTCLSAHTGTWKAYMAYHDIEDLEKAGNLIYVLASDNLYSYNTSDNSIQTFSKADALSDCDIQKISYNLSAKKLVIIYSDENIDLMDGQGTVTNVSDYYNATVTGTKTVNSIFQYENFAYLCTGFGILKLDVANAEIDDTYQLGFNVNWCTINGQYIYAYSSSKGEYQALLTSNLLDQNNWKKIGNYSAPIEEDKDSLKNNITQVDPGGPKYNYFGFMKFHKGHLYTCGGGWGVEDLRREGTIQVLQNDNWSIYEDDLASKTGVEYMDIACLDIDPKDNQHVFAGGKTGLYEFSNGKFTKFYNSDNSPIEPAETTNTENHQLILGVKFDDDGNLWILNSQASTQSIIEYTQEEKWISYPKSDLMKLNGRSLGLMEDLFFDSRGLMWFVNNNWQYPALLCYQPSTDALITFPSFTNEDGTELTVTYVRCVTEDLDGNIWLGTNIGPLELEPSEFTSSSPVFQQIKVPRNDGTNYADYLLSGVDITCMAIDGGGRKWFGSNGNGVYLISEDNMEQVHHFLSTNSPLLSNNIESIAINDSTGEVYIGTDKGLCSYMSDATAPNDEMTKDNVYAYPNPVRPEYTGAITITGLSYNADIKIVTSNGILVFKGTSNGGTFVWNGNDLQGKRVASGIYMVETATSSGRKGTVCKIAVIN